MTDLRRLLQWSELGRAFPGQGALARTRNQASGHSFTGGVALVPKATLDVRAKLGPRTTVAPADGITCWVLNCSARSPDDNTGHRANLDIRMRPFPGGIWDDVLAQVLRLRLVLLDQAAVGCLICGQTPSGIVLHVLTEALHIILNRE